VVYVDSGSTDGSVEYAQSTGCQVVCLDMSVPFTAARARNAGFQHALSSLPGLISVQFVDGDCEIVKGWLESAMSFLDANSSVAVVCGGVHERYPEKSLYNQLCDIEWQGPSGLVKSCGGNAMIRVIALRQAGGYRPDLIAGEEPELCVRLRASGWQIWRLGQSMVFHDAAMYHLVQWWNRRKRGGYAFAQGAALHGAPPERHWVREVRSNWLWGLCMPVATLLGALAFGPWFFGLALVYPIQIFRIYARTRASIPRAALYSTFIVMGKFPEMLGQMKYFVDRVLGTQSPLIEHK
jgi:glycosyltransferase involved in cell wall biosynthesis